MPAGLHLLLRGSCSRTVPSGARGIGTPPPLPAWRAASELSSTHGLCFADTDSTSPPRTQRSHPLPDRGPVPHMLAAIVTVGGPKLRMRETLLGQASAFLRRPQRKRLEDRTRRIEAPAARGHCDNQPGACFHHPREQGRRDNQQVRVPITHESRGCGVRLGMLCPRAPCAH